jgi:hypothetical protein
VLLLRGLPEENSRGAGEGMERSVQQPALEQSRQRPRGEQGAPWEGATARLLQGRRVGEAERREEEATAGSAFSRGARPWLPCAREPREEGAMGGPLLLR